METPRGIMKKKYDTLVLNKSWVPVHIIGYKRCMSLIYQGHAKALDGDFMPYEFEDWLEFSVLPEVLDDGYMMINSVSHKIAVPDIIVLSTYNKINTKDVKYSRENVFQRDKFKCQYCGKQFKRDELTIDHIIPRSQGGTNSWDNIVACCSPCNHYKADRTPEQAGMRLKKKPTKPKWYSPLQKVKGSPYIRPNWEKFLKAGGI